MAQPFDINAFARNNGLGQGGMPPAPRPAAVVGQAPVNRVQLAGGILESYIMHDSIIPLEWQFRKLPPSGIAVATASEPAKVTLGTFMVPKDMAFVLLDYRFDIYRPSGAAVGDFVPLEERRLSTQIGWTITSSGKYQGNTHYELLPSQATPNTASMKFFPSNPNAGIIPGFSPPVAEQAQFDQARFSNMQAPSAGGLAMLPQRHHREGLMKVPYSWYINQNERLEVQAVIFGAVPIPIAFFEAEITGILVSQNAMKAFLENAAPQRLPTGGV